MDDDFHVCWRCGTLRDGTQDPTFVAVEEIDGKAEPPPGRPWQMSLAGLFVLITMIAVAVGMFVDPSGVTVHAPSSRRGGCLAARWAFIAWVM